MEFRSLNSVMRTSRASIDNFLSLHRIAVVGVSRNETDFSRLLWAELRHRGYELIPVNPRAETIDGLPSKPNLSSVDPAPEGVLLMTQPAESLAAVREAIQCGIKAIWFYRAVGKGAVSLEAGELAQQAGCDVVAGECPFMFLPDSGFPHSWHRAFKGLVGALPR